jgi:microsomal dipeptidase-like Zn-dependent dipeptidase
VTELPTDQPRRHVTIDAHIHGTRFLPPAVRRLRRITQRQLPADTPMNELQRCGLDVVIACAVGDRLVTRWWWPLSPWQSVLSQLDQLTAEAVQAGRRLITSPADFSDALLSGCPAALIGLEGADALAGDLNRLETLDALGVRVIGIMHYAHNAFGTVCMGWRQPSHDDIPAGRSRGLTALGEQLVDAVQARGLLVDVAHADTDTIRDICERSRYPILCSHTGAAAVHDFARYLCDSSLRAIAATGGVIGIWPFQGRRNTMTCLRDFAHHAEHVAGIVGVDHICLGTDTNGVASLIEATPGPTTSLDSSKPLP